MYSEDTIAAIATPMGDGGVGIVRLSGPNAERIALAVFVRRSDRREKLRSHMLYHGSIRDPENGRVLDEVLLTLMRRPRSYTGEDVVEINCHGGAFLLRQILGVTLAQGARLADRGEFTKRAFLNGRMDLAQAEGVLDLIHARTKKGLELAHNHTSGELSKWVGILREELLDILVQVEAAIDFPEEEIELVNRQELVKKIFTLRNKIDRIVKSYDWGRLHREGARVCICGRPNVGKSSLLNALVGEQRVIVSPTPGTTRDVIEDALELDGLPVVLWDTAGIRDNDNDIEQAGVALARQHIEKADATVVVLDGSEELTDDDLWLLDRTADTKRLVVINKNDLSRRLRCDFSQERFVFSSALYGSGIDSVKIALRKLLLSEDVQSPIVLTNLRHKTALAHASEVLATAEKAVQEPVDLLAVMLNEAKDQLEEIVGAIPNDYVLERIFSSFCIGK